MDFILGPHCTLRKHDVILVVVDRFSKWHILFPAMTVDASHVAYLFCKEIVHLHGLTKSDCFLQKYSIHESFLAL